MGQVSTRWSDDHRVTRPATDHTQCVTRHKNLTEVQNLLWDRFRDFFRFLVPNFVQVQFWYHPKNTKVPGTGRDRYRIPNWHQNSDNKLWGKYEKRIQKVWKGQVGKSRDRKVSRPRPNISVTGSETFFGTNFFPRPIPGLFSVPNFSDTGSDTIK